MNTWDIFNNYQYCNYIPYSEPYLECLPINDHLCYYEFGARYCHTTKERFRTYKLGANSDKYYFKFVLDSQFHRIILDNNLDLEELVSQIKIAREQLKLSHL